MWKVGVTNTWNDNILTSFKPKKTKKAAKESDVDADDDDDDFIDDDVEESHEEDLEEEEDEDVEVFIFIGLVFQLDWPIEPLFQRHCPTHATYG